MSSREVGAGTLPLKTSTQAKQSEQQSKGQAEGFCESSLSAVSVLSALCPCVDMVPLLPEDLFFPCCVARLRQRERHRHSACLCEVDPTL